MPAHSFRRVAALALLLACLPAGRAAAQDLLITGVVDGPLSGGVPKAIELYAVNDVADLSAWGVSSANNGNGPTGAPEFVFPGGAVAAGTYLYVASESTGFTTFFGFTPDFTSGAAAINGDDAIELFQDGVVVDVFGEVFVDGTGQPWEYLDGWAYRVAGTGPDGDVFVPANWTYSGPNALDGASTNAGAATPFPLQSFAGGGGGDAAPAVASVQPVDGATNVAVDTDVSVLFSEPVLIAAGAFDLTCSDSGTRTLTPSSVDGQAFELAVAGDFAEGEQCTLTVFAGQVTDLDAEDPPNSPLADFTSTFTVASAGVAGVIINEIHADPDSGAGDANGDGVAQFSQDEFVEIVNATGAPLDLSGWTLADAFTVRHTIEAGTVVADGCALVVFGGGTPTGAFGGALTQVASSGSLGLNNGGDTITIATAGGSVAAVQAYGGEGGNNQSLTRAPDLIGDFAQHLSVAGSRFSPGTALDGALFAGCNVEVATAAVFEVQGDAETSPLVGQTVRVEGVVTGDFQDADASAGGNLRGFYLQDAVGDGDPATSDGVFVFDGVAPVVDVQPGDLVAVTGSVAEFFGETQIDATTVEVLGSAAVPAPVTLSLPSAGVLVASNGEYIPDLEAFEGMLVAVAGSLTVTDLFNLDRFGEMHLVAGGRPQIFTNVNAPDPVALDAYLQDLGSRSLMLDDGFTIQNPDPIRYPAPGQPNDVGAIVRSGDTVSGLVGNLRFSRGSGGSGDALYRLMPTTEPVFTAENPRSEAPSVAGSLRVGALNTLNFFTTLDQRGADDAVEYQRQLDKLTLAIAGLGADIVGLIEVENNADASVVALVEALNATAPSPVWSYIDTGIVGTDQIKNAIIYRSDRAEPLGDFAVLDSSVDPRFVDTRNRPVIAQTFRALASGGVLTVAVKHLKSKGSDCDALGDPDLGDGQGNCNLTRTNATLATLDWLATDPTGAGDADFLVVGDFNAYLREDPLEVYRAAGWDNLLERFVGPEAYTFNFDRQSGVLDHAVASPGLSPQVDGAAIWHVNTDEADAVDYNLNFGRNPLLYDGSVPARASDHDAIIVGLTVQDGDSDGDGVADSIDACPATAIPEPIAAETLAQSRFALVDDDEFFDVLWRGQPRSFPLQISDTRGCSCSQILERTGSTTDEREVGCIWQTLEDWQRRFGGRDSRER